MDLLPNVFNPENGAEKNQTFFFKEKLPVSVQYFSIKIYNRWGNKVYEFEDANGSWIDDGHEGWDGQTRYGGKAKPGVYYYVILAKGWDNREFEVPGYVHIFW
jgi:flagellar hook assembly protein FlgD